VWIFVFAGSGNTNYMNYLLETFCAFEFEYPADMRKALMDNWLVNLRGIPGAFLEMDLMQEHFNFWLEKMAQHKGKEFDEPFYREIVSASVLSFLRLKDEMEDEMGLQSRSKKHTDPKLRDELRAAMDLLRREQVHKRRPGRTYGWKAEDYFTIGFKALRKNKLKDFIAHSTMYMDQLGTTFGQNAPSAVADLVFGEEASRAGGTAGVEGDTMVADTSDGDHVETGGSEPPPIARMRGGELCL
jgi:hypothetical protein